MDKPELSEFNLSEEDFSRCEDGTYLRARNRLKNRDARNFGICALAFFLLFAAFFIADYVCSGIFDFEAANGGIAWFSVIDGSLFTLFACFLERWFLALERYAKTRGGREVNRKAEVVAFAVLAGVFFACVAAYVISYFVYWHDMFVAEHGYFDYDAQTVRFVSITVSYSVLTLTAFSAAVHISRKHGKTAALSPEEDNAGKYDNILESYRAYLSAVKNYREYEKGLDETNKSYWSNLPLSELEERFTNLLSHMSYRRSQTFDAAIFEKEGDSFAAGFKTGGHARAADIKGFIDSLPPLKKLERAIFVSVGGYAFPLDRPGYACANVRTYAENKGVRLMFWTLEDLLRVAREAGATVYDERDLPEALMPLSRGQSTDDGVTLGADGGRKPGKRRRFFGFGKYD